MEPAVFEAVLQRIQAKIRMLDYVMTVHADEEMDEGEGGEELGTLGAALMEALRGRPDARGLLGSTRDEGEDE